MTIIDRRSDSDDLDAPMLRAPAIQRELDTWAHAMRVAKDDARRLQAIATTSKLLVHFGDDAIEPRDYMTEISYNMYNLAADQVQAAMADGVRRAKRNGAGPEALDQPGDPGSAPDRPPPLQWLDMSAWDSEPVPQRKWAIKDRVPLNQAGLFSGEGGTGKSIIELQKNVAHVAGKDWFGSLPEPGPAFYIGAEDDKDEIHIRLAAIAKHFGVTFRDLAQLHVLCLLGQDATLCATGKSGKVETTALYRQLYEAAGDIKPKNTSIDTLSRAFAGNEIDRVQVYAFAQHMQALGPRSQDRRYLPQWTAPDHRPGPRCNSEKQQPRLRSRPNRSAARGEERTDHQKAPDRRHESTAHRQENPRSALVAGGSVTVLSHPSLAGINSGSGISGSTAWHGAFRFRQYLKGIKAGDGEQPDNDLRELEFKKNQYGPIGETIALRYQRGLFLPIPGISNLDKLEVRELIDREVKAIGPQGRPVKGDNITFNKERGTNPTYILRRLKRDHPELAEQVVADLRLYHRGFSFEASQCAL